MIKRHPDFICIAAGNTYGTGADRQYVGRNQLDGATLDRFVFLDWDYDEDLELEIAPDRTWTQHVQSVRKAVQKLKVRHIVSMRASIKGGKMLAAGQPLSRIKQTILWKGLSLEEISKIEAAI
jgi:MoxR-like ATPase